MNATDTNRVKAVAEYNAGVNCHQSGRHDAAIDHYRNAIALFPELVEAQFNLGNAFYETNKLQLAIEAYENILGFNPAYAKASYNLGNVYKKLGRPEDALAAYHQALRTQPDYAEAMNNIGVILQDTDLIEEALTYFKQALITKPGFAEASYNCGVALQKMGKYEAGRRYYHMALEQKPDYAPAHWLQQLSLPMIYDRPEDIDEHRRIFTSNLAKLIGTINLDNDKERAFALQGISSTTHFFLQYQCRNDRDLQVQYGRFVCNVMAANFPQWTQSLPMPALAAGEKLRIGYVSSMMYAHTIGTFLLGWVQSHNVADFQIHCYYLGDKVDALTRQLARHAHRFHHFGGDVISAAEQITRDQLHILVHTDIGMNPVTLQLAALRLAPIQCKGWGHPVTTGLPTMDYYLSSQLMEPDDAAGHYSETLVRLPNLALFNSPPVMPGAPRSRSSFGIPENSFVFLSSQSLFKYLPQHDDIYPGIAAQVPGSKFVFIQNANPSVTEKFKRRLMDAFKRQGLDGMQHCLFIPRLNHPDFLSLNMASDVLLDTFGWSGGKTTLEALGCGLPVVTNPGPLMRGRHAFAMLKMMDVPSTIANDKSAYCQIAVRLATDRNFYQQTRSLILKNRERLYHDHRFMQALEDFYRSAVVEFSAAPAGTHTAGPRESIAHYNRGVACQQEKDYAQAIGHYRKALELRPDWPEAMFNLACALKMHSDFEGALGLYLRLAELNPQDTRTPLNIGSLYLERGDGENALLWLEKARQGGCDNAIFFNNLGRACILQKKLSRAREYFERAIHLNSDLAEAWFNLADLDHGSGRVETAIAHYQKAIDINPVMTAAYNNMGNALRSLKRYPEAVEAFKQVVTLEPGLAQGHYNLGSTFRFMDRYPEAMVHLSKAIELQPAYADAWNNLALTCKNVGDLDRAMRYFNKALQLQPDLAVAHWNRSFVHFLKGDWSEGWQDFDWRFRVPHWRTIYPHRIPGKLWCGDPIKDQTLLVHDEQGLGDTFQFVRFLPWARQHCGHLIFETRPELAPLLENTPGIDKLILRSDKAPPTVPFDRYLPLMSLGRMVNADPARMLSTGAYIVPAREKIDQWRQRVPSDGFNVGLVWAGRPEHGNDANRSCRLELFAPLFELPGFHFIGLQKGPAAAQAAQIVGCNKFENWGDDLENFGDTAGLIQHLDLVLTVDTSVAHLAGAMGRPVWVLIPFIPDWRWGIEGTRTPWYPTMRLFRQQAPEDWRAVIDRIRRELLTYH